ncbi:sensor histidine kinase [Kaistia terrae]|uniref:histidine kinase n=1 Tax=Kaistia terrae TaxID=537017 RepID=A0ABW0PTJ5_9HYPH|nr:ATP-binding protein [Kaistia terrae]MCX5577031.1 ATP-binding protein [Kaistia terrae]
MNTSVASMRPDQAALDSGLPGSYRGSDALPQHKRQLRILRRVTLSVAVIWLALVAGMGWWMSQRTMTAQLDSLASSAEYEAITTARVMDRLFTEMVSVSNMVASQAQVIELATRYRIDAPGAIDLTRPQRAAQFTRDPLAQQVGDYMDALASDLNYARIYMNNLSDDTVTASNWAAPDSIVGMIYSGRPYLVDALRDGKGSSFGIARLNKTPSYFVSSRIDDENGAPLGSVTVKFDAPDVAHYLTGRHVSLVVNRQGRVITASSEPFMLRNVATLLPPGTVEPPDGEEELGEAMDVRSMAETGQSDQWLIEGRPYLLRQQSLTNTPYQLLTLASLEALAPMRMQHLITGGLAAGFGLLLILLCGRIATQLAERRLRAEQDRVLAISKAAERDLTIKVRERTAELAESNASLEEEVDRRHGLEVKLRQSLDSVNDALVQQRDFLALVTHEFRGPLAVIAGAADNMALSTDENSEDVQLRAARIRRTVNRMSMLIENVLAGDRLDAAEKPHAMVQTFDLNEILRTLQAALDDDAVSRVSLLPGDEAKVSGDRYLLEIALQNLVQNALKYSASPTPVTVRLSVDEGMVFVNVTDQGSGVPPEYREFIFLKYYRAAGQRANGSGLGLYISREIARQHGGALTLVASDASGTTFRLSLPLAGSEVAALKPDLIMEIQ